MNGMAPARSPGMATLFLAGDVMTGRGIDQVLPHPADPRLYEAFAKSANDYVMLAERKWPYSATRFIRIRLGRRAR